MLTNITYYPILGFPLIMYFGLLTLLSLLGTATLGYLIYSGKAKPPITISTHRAFAYTTIALALIHGALGLLIYLHF